MHDERREIAQARNEELRDQIGALLETFDQQRRELAEAQSTLAATTVTAWSSDKLIRVESNAAGVPVAVHVEPDAYRRIGPAELGRSITEAVQAAAQQARDVTQQTIAPIEELAGGIPDLADLVPGAPAIRDLVRSMLPETPAPSAAPRVWDEDAEDEYYRNRSYLRERP
ncbi:YbaB/EbfC family nucleoid-associated protein [Nocardia sp. NPDC049149]|uniref:YbaB/EbfC family nucleoid-associated protein n=1 Tax=Nocardia sp. NPDC049149 TaxID=3364315 RepID=UPI003714FE01